MTDSRDLHALSDDALAVRCKRNRVEEWLHQFGCLGGLLIGAASAAAVILCRALGLVPLNWWLAGCLAWFSFFVTGFLAFGGFATLARLRCRVLLRELEGRYGLRPLRDYVNAMQPGVQEGEMLILFVGQGLPNGSRVWACVRLLDGAETGTMEVRGVAYSLGLGGPAGWPDFGKGVAPKDNLRIAAAELPPEKAARLGELARQVQHRKVVVGSVVRDGYPVNCAVIDGTTQQVGVIHCNLLGVPTKQASRPHILLVREVAALCQDVMKGH